MKKVLGFGFLLMGFTFTVTQGLLIRELLVVFYGNELSIGLILGNWLLLEAAGSGLLGRWADRWGRSPRSFAGLQVLFALFLPLCLYATHASRSLTGALPGEGVGLLPIFTTSFLILAPLAAVDGAMFAFGCVAYSRLVSRRAPEDEASPGATAPAIGRVYVLEALGAIAGGILFTYLMIPFLEPVQMALLLSALNLLAAGMILARARKADQRRLGAWLGSGVLLTASVVGFVLLLSPWAGQIQRRLVGLQWPGYDLLYSENSAYGNVAVIQRQGQYTFFADGLPILTAPVPDVALSEEMVHLPLLFVPEPRRALVLSGGVGGVLHELNKYPLARIDYAELDPLLVEAVRQFPTPLTEAELSDPRVQVEPVDGRLLVQQRLWAGEMSAGEPYDLILINLPYPSTLQLNRFYTAEFFGMVRALLSENGVLALSTPGRLSYLSDELRDLNAMAFYTLRQAFPHIRPIPGDVTLWLASPAGAVTDTTLEALVGRWEERGLETDLMTPAHIRLRLDRQYLDWFWASLGVAAEAGENASPTPDYVNSDLQPAGLFYGLSYWNALFSPPLGRAFAWAGRLNPWALGLLIIASAVTLLATMRLTGRARGAVVPLMIGATGFAGMAADLIVIFAFQTFYGYVYQWIGLLITAFMAGLSLGGWLMTRRVAHQDAGRRRLLALEGALVAYWLLLPLVLGGLYTGAGGPGVHAWLQGLLLLLNAVAGFLVGSQFPLANQVWLSESTTRRGTSGVLYACDLLGAFLGSVLVAVVLMPVVGLVGTCLLVAVLKAGSLLLVAASPRQ